MIAKPLGFLQGVCFVYALFLRGLSAKVEADDYHKDCHKEFSGDKTDDTQIAKYQGQENGHDGLNGE